MLDATVQTLLSALANSDWNALAPLSDRLEEINDRRAEDARNLVSEGGLSKDRYPSLLNFLELFTDYGVVVRYGRNPVSYRYAWLPGAIAINPKKKAP